MKLKKAIPQIVVLIVVLGMLVPVNVVGQRPPGRHGAGPPSPGRPGPGQPPPSSPGSIESVSPTYANQGDTDVQVTITLSEQGAPPSQVAPLSVTIGTLAGDEINRNGLMVTAVFDIPADEPTGMKDVSVKFPAPRGTVTFTKSEAFEIQSGQPPPPPTGGSDYVVVDTGQDKCYNNSEEIPSPNPSTSFYGQDAQYDGIQPDYQDNGDGTVTDLNTGLMWQKTPDLDNKSTYAEAVAGESTFRLAGYDDWRLPTIKELYSLINFNGVTGMSAYDSTPYTDTDYFDFEYGDTSAGERFIDAQYCSSTKYVSTTMNGDETVFGVNFADGRIKGYGMQMPNGTEKKFFVRYVRGNPDYGVNDFSNNGDGTIIDNATGLIWSQADSGEGMDWEDALAWVQQKNEENYLSYNDWRLPNAKELQSIVDYTRSPATTNSAAIDPIFSVTPIIDEGGETNYPFYWTNTTHLDGPPDVRGTFAVYIAFGEALGYMEMPPRSGNYQLLDVHGAGAQRSDPKSGNPADWPYGNGPQGDVVRIYNYVRCVREGPGPVSNLPAPRRPQGTMPFTKSEATEIQVVDDSLLQNFPNPFNPETWIPYQLAEPSDVQIRIFNASGQLVRTLSLGYQRAGVYSDRTQAAYWDGRDDAGERVSSGVYFYTIRAGDFSATRKMLIVK